MSNDKPSSERVEVPFDEAFSSWLSGGTIAQRSVVIHSKPSLIAKYQELDARMKVLERKERQNPDRTQGDTPEMTALLAEWQECYDEWMASKSTWYVTGLSDDQINLVRQGTPRREAPAADAPKDELDAHAKWVEAQQTDLNLRTIAVAVLRIEFGDGKVSTPPPRRTLEDVRAVADMLAPMVTTIGGPAVLRLMEAIAEAANEEEYIPAPKLPKPSGNDQG